MPGRMSAQIHEALVRGYAEKEDQRSTDYMPDVVGFQGVLGWPDRRVQDLSVHTRLNVVHHLQFRLYKTIRRLERAGALGPLHALNPFQKVLSLHSVWR